ncbi:MAG: DNA-binding NtrC family response regulator [Myxococcota bacterium]
MVVDDDRTFRISTAELLRQDGHEVHSVGDAVEAEAALKGSAFDLVLLDLRMPGLSGVRFLEVLRLRGERLPVLMISGFGTVEAAVEALQIGADDFLTKPVDPDVLSAKVEELLDRRPMPEARAGALAGIVGRSASIREVFKQILQVAPSDTTVFVTGETGTGKELVARAIHEASNRVGGPFIPVNCASLAEGVLESELFGHVKGSFTGAVADKTGLFRAAHGGTLFLDEVGDMSQRLQQRLLRALQEGEVLPVGAVSPQPVDVRVIAATHRDLQSEVDAGRFREDLLYRLRVFEIPLPPLRARKRDIPLLIEAGLLRLAARAGTDPIRCSPLAVRLMQGYPWPGNVRELFSAVESSAIRADGGVIQAQDLPPVVREGGPARRRTTEPSRAIAGEGAVSAADLDHRTIQDALDEAGGVRVEAARGLGVSRTTLWRRMKELGMLGSDSGGSPA